MTIEEKCIRKDNPKVFDSFHSVSMGKQTYLIKRRFIGTRDIYGAVFSAVENEVKRDNDVIQAG